jgi:hypothetical protein
MTLCVGRLICFVLVQLEADEGVGGDGIDEGVEMGRDAARAETFA